ncbi:MAG: co-chaperone GroES [Candidatus Spechtbacteria bacterium]|nr:co-chaperone GroES [Candidatus Spechtbacteria bacterium]
MAKKVSKPVAEKGDVKVSVQPLRDHVLIEPLKQEEKTASGLYIPSTAEKERPEQGRVVAVGLGRFDDGERVPMEVKKGDKVLFSKYGPTEIKVNGKEYLVAREEDILAIIG